MPRFSARRSIPEQARALKKYFRRRGDVGSSTSDRPQTDQEDALPSLGDRPREAVHGDILCVENSVGDIIVPEVDQRTDEGVEVESWPSGCGGGKHTRDVFVEQDSGM